MATIVTRSGKGSALTIAELDANFNNLNTGKLEETPTRASVRPTLLLDFAKSKTLDPRVTFTRASVGTYTDSAGLLRVAPANTPRFDHNPTTGESLGLLIEESRTNLLTYSEQFDNAAWTKDVSGTPVVSISANSTTAPDGTVTADTLTELAVTNFHRIAQSFTFASGVTYTYSVYVKNASGSRYVGLSPVGSQTAGNNCTAVFDLPNKAYLGVQTAGSALVGSVTSPTITELADGWFRLSLSFSATPGGAGGPSVWLLNTFVNNGSSQGSYAGDGTSGIYIWGAQLEAGSFATSYVPSTQTFTGRTSTGTFIGSNGLIQTAGSGVARFQYNPLNLNASPFLLLEAAATNLLTWSEQFNNAAWTKLTGGGESVPVVTENFAAAPDGTTTASRVVLARSGNATSNYSGIVQGITASSQTRTFSVWMKSNTTSSQNVAWGDSTTNYTTAVVTTSWQRFSLSSTSANPGLIIITRGGQPTFANSDASLDILVWGAQLEAGSFATSYIPTVASTVTRSADTSTSAQTTRAVDLPTAPITPWFNISQGSWYMESTAINPTSGAQATLIAVSAGGSYSTGNGMLMRYNNGTSIQFGGNSQAVSANANAVGTLNKIGASYQGVNASLVVNGGSAGALTNLDFTGSGSTTLVLGALTTGSFQQGTLRLRKLAYFPKRLTDAELQAITTP